MVFTHASYPMAAPLCIKAVIWVKATIMVFIHCYIECLGFLPWVLASVMDF